VLGFATGASPVQTYQELVQAYGRKEISFSQVTSFNLDEYWGLEGDHDQSYRFVLPLFERELILRYFMDHNLFHHVDIKPYKTHVLNGKAVYQKLECQSFEDKIYSTGGMMMMMSPHFIS
jgi:glucosamine-6-phosphate deaminase